MVHQSESHQDARDDGLAGREGSRGDDARRSQNLDGEIQGQADSFGRRTGSFAVL